MTVSADAFADMKTSLATTRTASLPGKTGILLLLQSVSSHVSKTANLQQIGEQEWWRMR